MGRRQRHRRRRRRIGRHQRLVISRGGYDRPEPEIDPILVQNAGRYHWHLFTMRSTIYWRVASR